MQKYLYRKQTIVNPIEEHSIFNVQKVQEDTMKSRWWESEWFKEWEKLAKEDYERNNPLVP